LHVAFEFDDSSVRKDERVSKAITTAFLQE